MPRTKQAGSGDKNKTKHKQRKEVRKLIHKKSDLSKINNRKTQNQDSAPKGGLQDVPNKESEVLRDNMKGFQKVVQTDNEG